MAGISSRRASMSLREGGVRRLAVLAFGAACVLTSHAVAWNTESDGAAPTREFGAIHRAMAKYVRTGAALAAGYVLEWSCGAYQDDGMRLHYALPLLLRDGTLELERPQILVYERRGARGIGLRTIAYRVGQRAWHGAGNDLRPTFLGQRFELVDGAGVDPYYQLTVQVSSAAARFFAEQDTGHRGCALVRQ
jgi:hypothetical protein